MKGAHCGALVFSASLNIPNESITKKPMTVLYSRLINPTTDVSVDVNNKPVALLIHGLFGSGDNLGQQAKALSETYQVYLVDALNHGLSARSTQMDYRTQAQALVELIDEIGHKSVTLIGHSMGGKVAMACALLYPNKVAQLVVADITPVAYPRSHDKVINALKSINLDEVTSRAKAAEQLETTLTEPGVAQFLLKSLYREDNRWQWRFNIDNLARGYEAIIDWPLEKLVFDKQVLFVK
jgi:esterase